jgi:hypothetical protein
MLFENNTALYDNAPTGKSSADKPGATNVSTGDLPSTSSPSVAATISMQSSFVALAAAFAACSMLL